MLQEQQELAREVLAFREKQFAEQGSMYAWRKSFLRHHFNIDSLTSPEGKAAVLQVKSAARLQGWQEREKGRQGKQPLRWEKADPAAAQAAKTGRGPRKALPRAWG